MPVHIRSLLPAFTGALQRVAEQVLTDPAPLEIYRNAFDYAQFGYASAMGVALFFLTLTFAALTLRVTRREAVEL